MSKEIEQVKARVSKLETANKKSASDHAHVAPGHGQDGAAATGGVKEKDAE